MNKKAFSFPPNPRTCVDRRINCIAHTAGKARAFIQTTENRAEATGKKFRYVIYAEEVKP